MFSTAVTFEFSELASEGITLSQLMLVVVMQIGFICNAELFVAPTALTFFCNLSSIMSFQKQCPGHSE